MFIQVASGTNRILRDHRYEQKYFRCRMNHAFREYSTQTQQLRNNQMVSIQSISPTDLLRGLEFGHHHEFH